HGVAFLECLVAFRHDGCVMDEHIGATVLPDESVALCVIEPLHFARYFQLLPLLGWSWDEAIRRPSSDLDPESARSLLRQPASVKTPNGSLGSGDAGPGFGPASVRQ